MRTYDRRLYKQLSKELGLPRVVVLTGMRQVGKTTLMRRLFDEIEGGHKVFLDLENPLNQKVFEEDNFDNILRNLAELGFTPAKRSYVFLDEVQNAPKIVKAIKYLFDHYRIKFFLTGSSSYYLKDLFPESLAGRKALYELSPLDFDEFLVFKGKRRDKPADLGAKARSKNKIGFELDKKLFDEYLEFGGFPAVALESDRGRKRQILEDIFKSYFEKDVKSLADFRELGKMRDLILLLTARVGSKLEVSKISSEIGISRETAYSYLGFLEKTYFVSFISPFSRGVDGEVRGAKKVFFCDTGLLNYLGRMPAGAILENAVFLNLRKYGDLNYYEKYKGPEVDFILDKRYALEVKTKGDESDSRRLKRIAEGLKIKKCYLVTKEYSELACAIPAQDI